MTGLEPLAPAVGDVVLTGNAVPSSDVVLAAYGDALLDFLDPSTLAGVVVDGLAKAALFVMVASGLSLIFGLMGVLNFAHGSLTMIGAYLGGLVMVTATAGVTGDYAILGLFVLAAVLVFAVLAAFGGAVETTLIRPLYDRPLYQILLTFGLTLVLDEAVRIVLLFYDIQPRNDWQESRATRPDWLRQTHDVTAPILVDLPGMGSVSLVVSMADVGVALAAAIAAWGVLNWSRRGEELADEYLSDAPLAPTVATGLAALGAGVVALVATHAVVALTGFGPLDVRAFSVFEIVLGLLTVGLIWTFLTATRYGLVLRAGSEDPEMTAALGIDVRRAFTVVFGLGVGLAGVAGTVLMWDPRWGASVPLAQEVLLPAFVVVIVGGLGSFRGTVVAAMVVGFVDATMTWWFQNVVDFPGLPELTVFLILVGMLIVRPQGLFGVEEVGGH